MKRAKGVNPSAISRDSSVFFDPRTKMRPSITTVATKTDKCIKSAVYTHC